jgi:hypothetical protein
MAFITFFYIYIHRWNQLDVVIVVLSVVGIILEEVESKIIPINPTIIRVMRVLRIARGQWQELDHFETVTFWKSSCWFEL